MYENVHVGPSAIVLTHRSWIGKGLLGQVAKHFRNVLLKKTVMNNCFEYYIYPLDRIILASNRVWELLHSHIGSNPHAYEMPIEGIYQKNCISYLHWVLQREPIL